MFERISKSLGREEKLTKKYDLDSLFQTFRDHEVTQNHNRHGSSESLAGSLVNVSPRCAKAHLALGQKLAKDIPSLRFFAGFGVCVCGCVFLFLLTFERRTYWEHSEKKASCELLRWQEHSS